MDFQGRFKLPMVARLDGNAGNLEVIDTVPGGEDDVKEKDLNKVETASFARERHLQLACNWSKSKFSFSDQIHGFLSQLC